MRTVILLGGAPLLLGLGFAMSCWEATLAHRFMGFDEGGMTAGFCTANLCALGFAAVVRWSP